jgi:hypothetical protein
MQPTTYSKRRPVNHRPRTRCDGEAQFDTDREAELPESICTTDLRQKERRRRADCAGSSIGARSGGNDCRWHRRRWHNDAAPRGSRPVILLRLDRHQASRKPRVPLRLLQACPTSGGREFDRRHGNANPGRGGPLGQICRMNSRFSRVTDIRRSSLESLKSAQIDPRRTPWKVSAI